MAALRLLWHQHDDIIVAAVVAMQQRQRGCCGSNMAAVDGNATVVSRQLWQQGDGSAATVAAPMRCRHSSRIATTATGATQTDEIDLVQA